MASCDALCLCCDCQKRSVAPRLASATSTILLAVLLVEQQVPGGMPANGKQPCTIGAKQPYATLQDPVPGPVLGISAPHANPRALDRQTAGKHLIQ